MVRPWRLPWNFKFKYLIYCIWPVCHKAINEHINWILDHTMALIFQSCQIYDLFSLRKNDPITTKRKKTNILINKTPGLKCGHQFWPWLWIWAWIFKDKYFVSYISGKMDLLPRHAKWLTIECLVSTWPSISNLLITLTYSRSCLLPPLCEEWCAYCPETKNDHQIFSFVQVIMATCWLFMLKHAFVPSKTYKVQLIMNTVSFNLSRTNVVFMMILTWLVTALMIN